MTVLCESTCCSANITEPGNKRMEMHAAKETLGKSRIDVEVRFQHMLLATEAALAARRALEASK